jgi:hypothetical protein
LRDPFEHALHSCLEPRGGERIYRSDIGQDQIKLGEGEL